MAADQRPSSSTESRAPITVALAGQPNVGKSTIFNLLTGLSQHVGNWPGKTVEQKTGLCVHGGRQVRLVDLPGTYSLTANSDEERAARDFIIHERPDIVVVILNAAALERNLYLVAELLALPVPLVIGLNMLDVADRQGVHIEPHVLAAALGLPVVPLVAARNQGVRELLDAAMQVLDGGLPPECAQVCAGCPAAPPSRPIVRAEHQPVLEEIRALAAGKVPAPYGEDWVALKLLEGDAEIMALMRAAAPETWDGIAAVLRQHDDAYLDIAGGRYEWIGRMVRAALTRPRAGVITLTDRFDRLATHPLWGLALLVGVLALTFWLVYLIAAPVVDLCDQAVGALAAWAQAALAGAPVWLSGLVVNGVINGAGTVLTFLPILAVFFMVLGLFEDVGYLARVAFVMDRFMHALGLHGHSCLPLFLGFGCNVPAVIGTRIVAERRARLLTILLIPLVPCTGRMAVIAFLAPAFFGSAATLVTWGLVAANLAVLAVVGIAANRLAFKGERAAFIMELPLYHLPSARTIALFVWHNTLSFIHRAGTIILAVSVITWALATLPGGTVENSWLATFGRQLEPAGAWLGLNDWRLIVALLSSFVAKENTIATLGVLYGTGTGGGGLGARMAGVLSPSAALAFLVVQMLFVPCVATVATIRHETGSWRWAAHSIVLLLAISLGAGIAVYQLAALAALGG